MLHGTYVETARSVQTATLLGCRPLPLRLPAQGKMQMVAANEPNSPFSHLRLHTRRHGKMLVFSTGNIIRAGKHTHADAAWAVLAMRRWAMKGDSHHALLWPTAMSAPNAVCNGQLSEPMPQSIYTHWRATHTDKFPGIALEFASAPGITAEFFMKEHKFILPGVTNADNLVNALVGFVELHTELKCQPGSQVAP